MAEPLDKNYDFPSYRGPCIACRHLHPDGYAEPRCAAFPSRYRRLYGSGGMTILRPIRGPRHKV